MPCAHRFGALRDDDVETALDTRAIPASSYQLAVRRQGEDWRPFPAHLP